MNATLKFIRSSIVVNGIICVLVFFVITGLRNSGMLQFFELAVYDYYTHFQSKSFTLSPHIVLITITEDDIQRQKRWPLTDSTLAQLLNAIIEHNPRVIGLDIYRDIPIPPGEEELTSVFSRYKNIVTVQKMAGGTSIGVPMPYVDPEFVGFSDVLVDFDKVVRRGLFFLDDGENTYSSFSLLMALLYLSEENIYPQPGELNPEHLNLGKTTFIPVEANDGSYINADARGYQFLIDYRGTHRSFPSFSLSDILNNNVPPEKIKDKIVIIGVKAESVKDFFTSPINRYQSVGKKTYGVELHAIIASQILKSAIDGSGPLTFINDTYEWMWTLMWCLLGCTFGSKTSPFWRFSLTCAGGIIMLVLLTYYLFSLGWWVPVVPPFLSWLASVSITNSHTSYQERAKRRLLKKSYSKHVFSIESELKNAHDIQMNIIPSSFHPFPDRPEIDIYAILKPAKEVGGDFYDFFFIGPDRLCLVIGDVSGKGVPAALFMSMVITNIRLTTKIFDVPDLILSSVNKEISRDNDTCTFVSVFLGILNIKTGELSYTNAGHNPPVKTSANNGVMLLDGTKDPAIGIDESCSFNSKTIMLQPLDMVCMYTDGVTEAFNKNRQMFSEERLLEILSKHKDYSSRKLVEEVYQKVQHFSEGIPQSDDITVLHVRYLPLKLDTYLSAN